MSFGLVFDRYGNPRPVRLRPRYAGRRDLARFRGFGDASADLDAARAALQRGVDYVNALNNGTSGLDDNTVEAEQDRMQGAIRQLQYAVAQAQAAYDFDISTDVDGPVWVPPPGYQPFDTLSSAQQAALIQQAKQGNDAANAWIAHDGVTIASYTATQQALLNLAVTRAQDEQARLAADAAARAAEQQAAIEAQRAQAAEVAAIIARSQGSGIPTAGGMVSVAQQQAAAMARQAQQDAAAAAAAAAAAQVQAQASSSSSTSTTAPSGPSGPQRPGLVTIGDAAIAAGVEADLIAASPLLKATYAAIDAINANKAARAQGAQASLQGLRFERGYGRFRGFGVGPTQSDLAKNALDISNQAKALATAAGQDPASQNKDAVGLLSQVTSVAGQAQDDATGFLAQLQAGLDTLTEALPDLPDLSLPDNTGLLLGIAAALGGVAWYLKKKGKL